MRGSPKIEGIPEIAYVCPPVGEHIFARRAARLRSLAPGHPLGDYLAATAWLADAQQAAWDAIPVVSNEKPLTGEFPFHSVEWRRDDTWRLMLKTILSKMEKAPLPPPARTALGHLCTSSPAELDTYADALLAGEYARIELASAPCLGAALQVYWTALAGAIEAPGEPRSRLECPVCAFPPVAGVLRPDSKLRYLVCGLCNTEWYLPRLTCSNCGSTESLSYLSIENDSGGTKAECCARCHAYLKLFYPEASPAAEPFADDVATLALDILVSEEGFSRAGPNFYLLPGTSEKALVFPERDSPRLVQ
jgi:FdhE protein